MALIALGKYNVDVDKYLWCDNDTGMTLPGVGAHPLPDTPAFNDHYEGAMNRGSFMANTPISPKTMEYQQKLMRNLAVGDILLLEKLPLDHKCFWVHLKSITTDARMEGATGQLTCVKYEWDADERDWVGEESTEVTAAIAARDTTPTPFSLARPVNKFYSLTQVEDGYVYPLYSDAGIQSSTEINSSNPYPGNGTPPFFYIFGLKIEALPTNTNMNLADTDMFWAFCAQFAASECRTGI